jgi:hypothetical protein
MIKKDYEAITTALRRHRWTCDVADSFRSLVRELANVFEADNPHFDRQQFFKDCNEVEED